MASKEETAIANGGEFERTKNSFMRAVAHNLRSPLAAAQSCLRVLASGAVKDEADVNKLVANALERGEDALDMVDGMLALLEVRTDSMPAPEEIDIEKDVRAAAQYCERAAKEKQIAIEIVPPSTPCTAFVGRKMFAMMMRNIIDNAVKYSDPGNTVVVRISEENGEVKIVTTNRGLLIDSSDFDNIFIEFWRAPNAKKYAPHGNGLGLPLVKSVADRIGGPVIVTSDSENGTSFTVTVKLKITS